MRSKFKRLCKPEVEFLIENCNFSKDESVLLRMASAGNSDIQIAEKLNISVSSVTKKKRWISMKILDFLQVSENFPNVYVTGSPILKEDLQSNIEKIKNILFEKLF